MGKTIVKQLEKWGLASETKTLSQYFLVNKKIKDQLLVSIPYVPLIEIGPGPGILTKPLAKRGLPIAAIEIDHRFQLPLQKLEERYPNLRVVFANALKVDFSDLAREIGTDEEGVWLVGNLPYQLTEPLMLKLARFPQERKDIAGATFLISERTANEMVKNSFPRGKIGIVTKAIFDVEEVASGIEKDSFYPKPRTKSALVVLRKLNEEEAVASVNRFVWQSLFAKPGAKVKNALREAIINLWRERERSVLDKRLANRRERRRARETLGRLKGSVSSVIEKWKSQQGEEKGGVMTKNKARQLIEELALPDRLLEQSVEQLNTTELEKLDRALTSLSDKL